MSVSNLWEEYSRTKSSDLRNRISTHYINFVKFLASRIIIPLPSGLEKEDLEQYGFFGLMEAIEKYDEQMGAKFETYAGKIINGRMIDRIRDYGKTSGGQTRTSVKKSKMLEEATKILEKKLGRHPTAQEIADEMDLTIEQYYKMLNDVGTYMQFSLDKMVGLNDNLPSIEVVKNENSVIPEEKVLKEERFELLEKAIDELPEKERMIVIFYYHEELTLKEIGNFFDLSESRISQLHTQAMIRLKSKMQGGL